MRSPAELTTEFRSLGLKVTPQRQLLFRLLHDNSTHPTADDVFELATAELPGISLRTVYQTLTDLHEMGELQAFVFDGRATRFDPNVGAHQHRVCDSCAEVEDVYVDGVDNLHAEGSRMANQKGFAMTSTDVVFRGLCKSCATQASLLPNKPQANEPRPDPSEISRNTRRSKS